MEDIAQWSLWIGMFLTPVISLLKKSDWVAEVKQLVALAVCLLASVATVAIANAPDGFSTQYLAANFAVIFATSQVFYTQLFEGTSKEEKLREINPYKGIGF